MPNVKNNYKNNHQNIESRICKNAIETQQHILEECPQIHRETLYITTPRHNKGHKQDSHRNHGSNGQGLKQNRTK